MRRKAYWAVVAVGVLAIVLSALLTHGASDLVSEDGVALMTRSIREWDISGWEAVEEVRVGPPKMWVSNQNPGDSFVGTLMIHAGGALTLSMHVSTSTAVAGEDGILREVLPVPLWGGGDEFVGVANVVEVTTDYAGDAISVDGYDSHTQTLVLGGFEQSEATRLVTLCYIPAVFTYRVYWTEPSWPDSCKELKNPVSLEPLAASENWLVFERASPVTTVEIAARATRFMDFLVNIPNGAHLPEFWEFWLTVADITGQTGESGGMSVQVEHSVKVLVTNEQFEFGN